MSPKMKALMMITDSDQLNVPLITDVISETYWPKGRTLQQVQKAIANSLNFGVYLKGKCIVYIMGTSLYNRLG